MYILAMFLQLIHWKSQGKCLNLFSFTINLEMLNQHIRLVLSNKVKHDLLWPEAKKVITINNTGIWSLRPITKSFEDYCKHYYKTDTCIHSGQLGNKSHLKKRVKTGKKFGEKKIKN